MGVRTYGVGTVAVLCLVACTKQLDGGAFGESQSDDGEDTSSASAEVGDDGDRTSTSAGTAGGSGTSPADDTTDGVVDGTEGTTTSEVTGGTAGGTDTTAGTTGEPTTDTDTGASTGTAAACTDMIVVDGQAFIQYCIDPTEVTAEAYQGFLDSDPSTDDQPPACSTNADFAPTTDGGSDGTCNPGVFDPVERPTDPVSCVDWCDAHAYCEWAGKRLCGNYKEEGGALATNQVDDWTFAEHFNACSAGGTSNYPWGNQASTDNCVSNAFDGDSGVQGTDVPQPVMSAPQCEGATPEVFDLSGNVREWENACNGASCSARGGSFLDVWSGLECDDNQLIDRFNADWETGFRCCANVE
ncbi:MAG: SUMF1/EgtB/PvdO family nonheme iron enzyme [Myxococcota bacterium]